MTDLRIAPFVPILATLLPACNGAVAGGASALSLAVGATASYLIAVRRNQTTLTLLKTQHQHEVQEAVLTASRATMRKAEIERQRLVSDISNIESKKIQSALIQIQHLQYPPQHPNEMRCCVLMVGLGGSGKTQLISSLADEEILREEQQKTERFRTEHWVHSPKQRVDAQELPQKYNFYVNDYLGQNIGQLVRAILEEQLKATSYSALTYGYINAFILVVDLFYPDSSVTSNGEPDPARVEEHLSQWSDTALDAVMGALSADIGAIIMYVNKADLVAGMAHDIEKKVKTIYAPLIKRLHERIPKDSSCELFVFVGSARRGDYTPQIVNLLMSVSSPGEDQGHG